MIYLKLYESFNNELIKCVKFIEYKNFVKDKYFGVFTKKEMEEIKKTLPFRIEISDNSLLHLHYIGFSEFSLRKYEDNWYTIRKINQNGSENFYICDDFESVVEFLNNKKMYTK